MDFVFHCNITQPHQLEHGQWWRAGLKRHGIDLTVTVRVDHPADVHIVSGPHYAADYWRGHRTLLLDRAYYHDDKSGKWASMDWVSLGWMDADGKRTFRCGGPGRPAPVCKTRPAGNRVLFLADFNGRIEKADTVRAHPANGASVESLHHAIRRHGIVAGYSTTALVAAALEGCDIDCRDPRHILNQPDWLNLLPWADWRYDEITSGAAWEHLKDDI